MTSPVRALYFSDRIQHRQEAVAGSIWISNHEPGGEASLWFFCPCGCGLPGRMLIGDRHKPHSHAPSWHWNGSTTEPTLKPSVNQTYCAWHGWLRDGYWERAA